MIHNSGDHLFPDVRFTHAVSIGGNCEAAHGLRGAGRHSARCVFDWLVTPLDAVAEILADDGSRLGSDFAAVHEGTSVRCGAYGVLYHHEFPRDPDNHVLFTAEAIANCRAKLVHKMATFLKLCDGGPLLFLRCGLKTDLPWDRFGKDRATVDDLDALAAALTGRFPKLEFRLLVTVLDDEEGGFDSPKDPRIAITTLPRQRDGAWAVADADWRKLMACIDFVDAGSSNITMDEPLFWFGGESSNDAETLEPPVRPGAEADAIAARSDRAAMEDALQRGDVGSAIAILSALVSDGIEPPDLAWQTGLALWKSGRSAKAVHAFAVSYGCGYRHLPFIRDYLGLLSGETLYADVMRLSDQLKEEGITAQDHRISRHLAMLSGHAKLALARPRQPEIDLATARTLSPAWLDTQTLLDTIAASIREQRPFAFIRVGDGEARYLIAVTHGSDSPVTADEAYAMGDLCWENWFGEPLSQAGGAPRTTLLAAYETAIRQADVIGACAPDRLRGDTGHYGYLSWQEDWLRRTLGRPDGLRWTDAQAHRHMNAQMPFLSGLLEGQDVLGVISPHPGLAEALKRKFEPDRVIGHVVPAEGRLSSAAETRALGKHFPTMYEDLLATLSVPRPGCVFLVAAGLLGKIYCARIKALGGIALDIGSLADAWMGHDTRDGQLADVAALSQVANTPGSPTTDTQDHTTTYGCLSIGKTSSMALANAIRNAGFHEAIHLHYLGPRALELKRAHPEPMFDLATKVAAQLEDANHRFRLVSSVRDPIARILSQAFYTARHYRESTGVDIIRDRDALVQWWEDHLMARVDLWSLWFEDSLNTPFGFDFKEYPFDFERKSVRFTSDRVRLLILRQEDDPRRREVELGWLLDCSAVALHTVNASAERGYATAYGPFLEQFSAPSSWLDSYYDSDVIRHFYSPVERDAFRARWRGARPVPVSLPDVRPRALACLSMMKTSSTALAAAFSNAGFAEVAHIHHLGPRSRGQTRQGSIRVDKMVRRLEDPSNRFAIVTCVRDPISRWISQAFHNELEVLARTKKSNVDTPEAFKEWIETKKTRDYSLDWFEDSLNATFGFDFRNHAFDFDRRSLRFSSERLRLLILRQEDPAAGKEAELGWLVERDTIAIPIVNDSQVRFANRYRAFLDAFVAPASWLETFYETEVARHFYTEAERNAFRARWSRPRHSAVPAPFALDPVLAEPAAPEHAASLPPSRLPSMTLELEETRAELATLKRRIRDGYVVDFNDYAYRPKERDWSASRGAAALCGRFDAGERAYATLLERFCGFDARFRAIPVLADEALPFWENWWLPGFDAVTLYGLVATLAPRIYLEIGSGHSTRFVRQAIRDNGLPTRIISIDPNPTAQIDALCDEVVRTPCEDAPMSVFTSLVAGDMLFFDGGHRSFQNSDSTVFFTEILPALAPGVVYGLHDVFLPYDYPESWLNRFYNEQYLLMAYLLGGAAGDEILFPAHHVSRHPAFTHLRNRLFLGTKHLDWLTSSFWMRRAG